MLLDELVLIYFLVDFIQSNYRRKKIAELLYYFIIQYILIFYIHLYYDNEAYDLFNILDLMRTAPFFLAKVPSKISANPRIFSK